MGNGAGVSFVTTGEELVTAAIMMESTRQLFAAMSMPGMYRLYDFHSEKAPRLKIAARPTFKFRFLNQEDDSSEDDEEEAIHMPDESEYSHIFKVMAGEFAVYLEDPIEENEAGWTPLHTTCMSLGTVEAGFLLIAETVKRGGSFETKTRHGPGHFNKGWTPLHMACAYGVEPLVLKLVEHGADVNSVNSYGFSCLLEACHRGFIDIVNSLLKARGSEIDLRYIPGEEETRCSPFSCAPSQSALGEASRCGFYKIVKMLLDAGAPKNLQNSIGWTPLHEACFYNRIETAKCLLLGGADATLRTRIGALPYHLSGLQDIKQMLQDMGGPDAVPNAHDKINMLEVLTELTLSGEGMFGDDDHAVRTGDAAPLLITNPIASSSSSSGSEAKSSSSSSASSKSSSSTTDSIGQKDAPSSPSSPSLLHSGAMLGDLPSLGTPATKSGRSPGSHSSREQQRMDAAMDAMNLDDRSRGSPSSLAGANKSLFGNAPSKVASGKKKGKKKRRAVDDVPEDMPSEYLCELTKRPMAEPVKTVYGNMYDKPAILEWMKIQGKICPLTGAPLTEVDLQPQEALGGEIREWIYNKSAAHPSESTNATSISSSSSAVDGGTDSKASSTANKGAGSKAANDDDLYDF